VIRVMLAMVFFVPAMALAAEDPIKAELDKARAAHSEELGAAKTKLVAAMEAKLREVAAKGDLDNAKMIKSQKELFEKDGTLPMASMIARAKGDYESDLRAARVSLRKALEKAKGDYTKAIKLDEAGALKELADVSPAKKGANPAEKAKPKVVATWAHQVGMGKNVVMQLYSNGKINDPDGRNTWQIKGGLMVLTWPNAAAPGGAWTDVVNLANDGKSYSGNNNKGTPILGTKLAAGDVDAEKKK